MDIRPVCIAVLACDHPDVDVRTRLRILRALGLAERYEWARVPVRICFMAGMGKDKVKETVAASMREYALSAMKKKGFEVPMFANHGKEEVWGTILEMRWAHKMAEKIPESRLIFVTNKRHGRRVLITNFFLHHFSGCHVEESNDEPPPWWHEILAYLKLCAVVLGLGGPAEAFRRRFYT